MKNYKHILLDADNTLFDFNKAEHDALAEVMKENGIILTQEQHLVYHEINDALWKLLEKGETTRSELKIRRFAEFIDYLGKKSDISAEKVAAGYVLHLAKQTPLMDGAMELCSYLSEKYILSIVTNGITYVQESRFALSPLNRFFTHLFISEKMGSTKPEKAYYDKVMAEIGSCDLSEYIMIGDSLSSDIQGAVNVGIDSIWLAENGKTDSRPTYTVNSLLEICNIL